MLETDCLSDSEAHMVGFQDYPNSYQSIIEGYGIQYSYWMSLESGNEDARAGAS